MSLFEEIMEVRDSGEVNMLDVRGVQYVANEMGFYELVCYIEENKSAISDKLREGWPKSLEEMVAAFVEDFEAGYMSPKEFGEMCEDAARRVKG